MAGEWASALSAAILGGQQSYNDVLQRKRQQVADQRAQKQFEQTMQQGSNQLLLQQRTLDDYPRQQAAAKAALLLQRDGTAAYDNPEFVKASAEAGTPLQLAPGFSGEPASGTVSELGYFPHTGAVAPAAYLAEQKQLALKQRAQAALFGSSDPKMQKAALYQAATGQAIPTEALKDGDWTVQRVRNAMGEDTLFRVNADTGRIEHLGGGGGMGAQAAHQPQPGVTGPEVLKGLDPKTAAIVQQLAEYKYPLPTPGSRLYSTPYWQNILSLVPEYDPTWTASDYDNRKRLKADFMSGQGSNNKASLSKLTQHLANLRTAAEALNNTSFPTWNAVKNSTLPTFTDDPRQGNFQKDALAVSTELAAYLKGNKAAPTNEEINHWMPLIGDLNGGPEQQNQGFNTIADIIAAQADALDQKWTTGMGKSDGFRSLDPETVNLLNQLRGAKRGDPMPNPPVTGHAAPFPPPQPAARPNGGVRIVSIAPMK